MSLYLQIALCSATCFSGSGAGRVGTVDVDLESDPQTCLPVIRGRILKGLLLEELALILKVLEVDRNGPWHTVAARLFGTPGQRGRACLSFGDGHLPADLRQAVAKSNKWTSDEVLQALTTVRYQTKMDYQSGAPEPHSLRSSRLLHAGLRFHALVRTQRPLMPAEQALLAACTAAVRRAGLHRNHGWGDVELRLLDDSRDVTAAWLARLGEPDILDKKNSEQPLKNTYPDSPSSSSPKVLKYRLTLTAPVVLANAGGDPSTVETNPYISGSSVLGAMAQRWLAQHEDTKDPANHETFRSCFLEGSVRWLNAYPEGSQGNRLLPCPLTLVCRKQDVSKQEAFDRANIEFPDRALEEKDETQWQPLEGMPFVSIAEEPGAETVECQLLGLQPRLTPRLHHTRDDREAGRSTSGLMFSYIALEAGQSFIGYVLCNDAAGANVVSQLIEREEVLELGRSRTATYGGWALLQKLPDPTEEPWSEAPSRQEFTDEEQETNRLVITLLSDYLGINAAGQPDPKALQEDLRIALDLDHEPVDRFLGTRQVSGYVSQWRMPRPAHPAISAGSVLVYEGVQPNPERLRKLHWEGIGTRRAEGFGRIALQWHGAENLTVRPNEHRKCTRTLP